MGARDHGIFLSRFGFNRRLQTSCSAITAHDHQSHLDFPKWGAGTRSDKLDGATRTGDLPLPCVCRASLPALPMSALPQIRLGGDQPADSPSEQQLRESQKMEAIGRLVGGVAHDFNNLLTGMVLCSELLLVGLEKDSRLRHYAEEIRSAGVQGAALIRQLLAVARQRVVAPCLLSLNEVITGMHGLLARLIGENIELVSELAVDLKLVRMDPAQVQQIILNLVLNARDAMPDGGRIALMTRNGSDGQENRRNGCLQVLGRSSRSATRAVAWMRKTRSHLFEPFFTTKKPGQGSGWVWRRCTAS